MEDSAIIQLYWARDERAIPETDAKYGRYCTAIARNILSSREDAEECVSDTYLHAWNAMPPQRPNALAACLGRITRNLSLSRWRYNTAEKRGGLTAVLDELDGIVSGRDDPARMAEHRALVQAIDRFLDTLPPKKRYSFLRRYWYADSIAYIAAQCGMRKGAVSMTLSRLRDALRAHLLEGGFVL